jgi:hypothetical protein
MTLGNSRIQNLAMRGAKYCNFLTRILTLGQIGNMRAFMNFPQAFPQAEIDPEELYAIEGDVMEKSEPNERLEAYALLLSLRDESINPLDTLEYQDSRNPDWKRSELQELCSEITEEHDPWHPDGRQNYFFVS